MKNIHAGLLAILFATTPMVTDAKTPEIERILADIGELESNRDPKCYATASRLEDFMYGTPLSDEARFRKNDLQKRLADAIWRAAEVDGGTVRSAAIEQAFAAVIDFSKVADGGFQLGFPSGAELSILPTDFRQYGTVAYSLRAILGAQQDALMNPDAAPLPPLDEDALAQFKNQLDLVALALLKEADAYARAHDLYEIDREGLDRAWLALYRQAPAPTLPAATTVSTSPEPPSVLLEIIEEKIAAYDRYNEISNPLFMRNMQVYFARLSWPADEVEAEQFRNAFIQALIGYAHDLYVGVVDVAIANNEPLVREAHVHRFVERYTPFEVNEYEDIVYFPKLGPDSVPIVAYDLDAFRDSGIHWLYLGQALTHGPVDGYLDVDPFAAELLAENVAQFGVLMLREAGLEGHRQSKERLSVALLESGIANIQAKVDATLAGESRIDSTAPAIRSATAGAGGEPTDAQGTTWFTDITTDAGIDYMHRSSDWLSRQMRSYLQRDESTGIITIPPAFGGSGVAAGDIDNDGDTDLLILGGLGNRLYRNDGAGVFEDITESAGLVFLREQDRQPGEPRQPLLADLDNDGWQDVIITYVNDDHRVWRNRGDGTFEDVTARAGLGGNGLVGGPATVFDYDNDGLLDVYVQYFGNYLQGVLPTLARRNDNGLPDKLFRNMGDFRFEEVDAGVADTGWGQATTHTDFDNDGWQDLISGNDFGTNTYYRNTGNGRFEDVTEQLGTGKPSYTMNIGLTDLNADQVPDIYISNIVTMNKDEKYVLPNEDMQMKFNLEKLAHLRVVEANDLFISGDAGADLPRYTLSRELVGRGYNSTGWSWGASFFDADLDGDDDLYVLNGMNEYNLYSSKNNYANPDEDGSTTDLMPVDTRERNVFFVNSGGKLQNVTDRSGLDLLGNSRSAAYLDMDNDGDLDMVLNNYHEAATVYRNNAERLGGRWIKLQLTGDPEQGVNRDAIGARVLITAGDAAPVWREIRGSEGYMTVHERAVHAGVGDAETVNVAIRWPGGQEQVIEGLATNRTHSIRMAPGIDATAP